jgi:hypothetical protein
MIPTGGGGRKTSQPREAEGNWLRRRGFKDQEESRIPWSLTETLWHSGLEGLIPYWVEGPGKGEGLRKGHYFTGRGMKGCRGEESASGEGKELKFPERRNVLFFGIRVPVIFFCQGVAVHFANL